MKILELLKGQKILVKTDVGTDAELTIASVEEKHNSQQITPDTPQNDWWGETREWTTFMVKFTNGHQKE